MTGKIFKSIFFVTLISLIIAAVAFYAVAYGNYRNTTEDELKRAAQFAAAGTELGGTEYLEKLGHDGIRVTLVDPSGKVIFDNVSNSSEMENHIGREEIAEALETGEGFASRRSETSLENTAYYAVKISDGSVLRVADTVRSAIDFIISMSGHLIAVFLIVIAAAALLASNIASSIVRPISGIDLSHPERLAKYKEFVPVAKRLSEQNRLISRKMEELSLRQTEFAAITDNMSEGMLVIDSGAEILSYNKSAEEMLGFNENMPKNITAVETVPVLRSAVADALSGKKSAQTIRSGGKYYSVIINPVIHENSVEGAVAIILDETEKEQREALRREFTSNISHELKTPLTSISGFAEIIMDGLADGDEKRFAGNIYREAQRLIVLVGDIIKLNRLDGGEIVFDEEPVDLANICKTVVERLSNIAEKADISLSFEGETALVRGNSIILEEMIYNLADNGIKYNNPGGSVKLKVYENNISHEVSVSCADNGIGIPEGQKERIFERFYRVDKSRSKSIGGTGLGLSIVKHGATCHNAKISVSSRENFGTTVTITFPPIENAV
jgi:two-component system phosphate regulon sensor histidine kinase PhoR